jgi:hypothetical protein
MNHNLKDQLGDERQKLNDTVSLGHLRKRLKDLSQTVKAGKVCCGGSLSPFPGRTNASQCFLLRYMNQYVLTEAIPIGYRFILKASSLPVSYNSALWKYLSFNEA